MSQLMAVIVCLVLGLHRARASILEPLIAWSSGPKHHFKLQEEVPLYASKIGPFPNPSEIYDYYDLPFCTPNKLERKLGGLGEILGGDRLVKLPFAVRFKEDKTDTVICSKILSVEDVQKFRKAILEDYYFQMYLDDLPIWGFIGKTVEVYDVNHTTGPTVSLFSRLHVEVRYNGDQIIEFMLSQDHDGRHDITLDKQVNVRFSYSLNWEETEVPFEKRMEKFTRYSFLPQHLEVHWFSIISLFGVLLLFGTILVTSLSMRSIKVDLASLTNPREVYEELLGPEEQAVKQDFSSILYPCLLSAVIGVGTQLATIILLYLCLAAMSFSPYSLTGTPNTAWIWLYVLTAALPSYVAAKLYRQLGGDKWVTNLITTSLVFVGPLIVTFGVNNTIASAVYKSSRALPTGTLLVLFFIWVLAQALTVLGAFLGKRVVGSEPSSSILKNEDSVQQDTPSALWNWQVVFCATVTGGGVYATIQAEAYYVLATMWGHRAYASYALLLVTFIGLLLVMAVVSFGCTYLHLVKGDRRWHWRSIFYGGSPALFLFAYCFYYFFFRSDMTGLLQTTSFFGYMACASYGLFLTLGAVGFWASLLLVSLLDWGVLKIQGL